MSDTTKGLALALTSYTIWGGFALFFSLLQHIPATEVLLHRIFWSFVFVGALIAANRRWHLLGKALRNKRLLVMLLGSSVLIAGNWLLYIWAVGQSRAVDASLGYFISPLVSVFLGVLFLKEKLTISQMIAVLLATLGVLYKLIAVGELPWIALTLASTFGLYSLIRKQTDIDAITGLLLETALLVPISVAYWLWLSGHGEAHFSGGTNILLLISAGVLTAIPLMTFAASAKHLSLTVLGLMTYIGPTLQLLSAVFILDERFEPSDLITFSLIWIGLLFLSGGALLKHRNSRELKNQKA